MALPPHVPLAVRIFPHLAECANNGRRTNTEELCTFVKGETRLFSRALTFIRDEICIAHNLPPITAIIEVKGKETMSNSFAPSKLASLSPAEYNAFREEK